MNTLAINQRFELIPPTDNKNCVSHIRRYNQYVRDNDRKALQPDLRAYRDYLLSHLSPTSVKVHLSHVRQAYRELIQNRDLFYRAIPTEHTKTISDQKAFVDETITRIEQAISPDSAPVKTITVQDAEDDRHTRLTRAQASEYLNSFGTQDIKSLRNTCLIGLMLCTGVRESELVSLEVDDLRQSLGGDLALRVKTGKGNKQRLIPYGQLSWVLVLVDKYLSRIKKDSGRVFDINARQVQNVVKSQPVVISGELRQVRPHDLRRTYAKLLYLEGMSIKAIADNLGHSSIKTTEKYIGVLDSKHRQPASIYTFDLSSL